MENPSRPRTPGELAQAIARTVGVHRVERIIGLEPVSPPEGHAFYAFVVLRDDASDARDLEAKLYKRFAPLRPRIDYWVMGRQEWERSHKRVGHPARSAHLEGAVIYGGEAAGEAGAHSVA
jgi:hypothetical protein